MTTPSKFSITREQWSWAFYDWANSAFVTTIMVAFFPIFFREFWAKGSPSSEITLHLGTANSIASTLIMLMAPLLGTIADQGGLKKSLLGVFVTIGVLATLGMTQVGEGQWQWAMFGFVIAVIGWLGANIFNDSLLVNVAREDELNRVSAFGYSLGYLGGGTLFALCVTMSLKPAWFGLESSIEAVRWSFALTALWWAIFSIPLFVGVKETIPPGYVRPPVLNLIKQSFRQLWSTVQHIRQLRYVGLFLLAYWLYIDGVDTVIAMSVDYGQALGFDSSNLITALLITQFVAFPAALGFGWIGNRIGAKRGILLGLAGYVLITIGASYMQDVSGFYALALAVGLVQGGVQALSRSLYASLIPVEQAAEFFGFYNMLGKFATVLGPLMVGWTGILTGSPRTGLLALLILFVLGGLLLWKVPAKH